MKIHMNFLIFFLWLTTLAFSNMEHPPTLEPPVTYSEVNELVPALYIFGDSYVDGGNNAAPWDYGLDLQDKSVPKRWTNGLTYADYIGIFLGLPIVPPFNNTALAMISTTGVNFGFAGSGIVRGVLGATTHNFDTQITEFNLIIANNLVHSFGKTGQLSNHLSNSIFIVSFGINDYSNYHPQDNSTDHSIFANNLLNVLEQRLTALYGMGARKFLVNNIWPIGCLPSNHLTSNVCDETTTGYVLPYYKALPLMLVNLETKLPGSKFSSADDFSFVQWLNYNTAKTGITNTTGACKPMYQPSCPNRGAYLYFDWVHTTQAANQLFALSCFNGTGCSPKNIFNLAGS